MSNLTPYHSWTCWSCQQMARGCSVNCIRKLFDRIPRTTPYLISGPRLSAAPALLPSQMAGYASHDAQRSCMMEPTFIHYFHRHESVNPYLSLLMPNTFGTLLITARVWLSFKVATTREESKWRLKIRHDCDSAVGLDERTRCCCSIGNGGTGKTGKLVEYRSTLCIQQW